MKSEIICVLIGAIVGIPITYYSQNNNKVGLKKTFIALVSITIMIALFYPNDTKKCKHDNETQESSIITENPITDTIETSTNTTPTESEVAQEQECSLMTLKPFDYESYSQYEPFERESNVEDILGTQYSDGFRAYMSKNYGEHSLTYRVDKKYRKLVFKVGIYEESKGQDGSGDIIIYADGVQAFKLSNLPSYFDTVECTVNLVGVKDLKIEMYGDNISLLMLEPTLYYDRSVK